ncbi:MAG: hypothetical protein Q7S11_02270 [bacterium]|nr:hypothetical protein [bacterium]
MEKSFSFNLFVAVILMVFASSTFAGNDYDKGRSYGKKGPTTITSSNAEAEASAKASAKANQNQKQSQKQTLNNDLSVTVNGGNNNGGSAKAIANPVVNNSPTVNANPNASSEISVANTIEATKAVPQTLIAPGVPGTPPELFPGIQATPINVADFKDYMKLTGGCESIFSDTSSPNITENGASKTTYVLANVFYGNDETRNEADGAMKYLSMGELTVECLGTVQVSGDPNSAYSADFGTIDRDAGIAAYKHFKIKVSDTDITFDQKSGKSGKYILMVPIHMVSVVGVRNGTSGIAASGSGSRLSGVNLFGVGVTMGGGDGFVFPDTMLGGKYYLFAPMKPDKGGTIIKIGDFTNMKTYYNLASGENNP